MLITNLTYWLTVSTDTRSFSDSHGECKYKWCSLPQGSFYVLTSYRLGPLLTRNTTLVAISLNEYHFTISIFE